LGTSKSHEFSDDEIARITAILKKRVRSDYAAVDAWRQELSAAIQTLVIKRLQPAVNQQLAAMPQDTLAEKQSLCRWANAELRFAGLTIQCPKTGHSAMLHADPGRNSSVGRFQIELLGGEHKRHRTVVTTELPEVQLRVDSMRGESLAKYWAKRLSSEKRSREFKRRQ
jgi:hypothetical protein